MKTPYQYATEVASYLAPLGQWRAEPGKNGNDWYAYATRSDGMTLHFNTSHQKDNRLEIRMSIHEGGLNPFFRSYGSDSVPSVTVSGTKTSDVIARDVTRRLLPDADKLYATLLERKAASDTHHAKCDENQRRMIAASEGLFVSTASRDGHGFDAQGWSQSGRGWYTQDCYASSDSVQLEFRSLPVDLAEAIIKTIAIHEQGRLAAKKMDDLLEKEND